MLIELRSSPVDPNNTPASLHQRFNETLILKPNTRVALVSALTTTNASGSYVVDATNAYIQLTVGNLPVYISGVPFGSYTGTRLAQLIQNALRYSLGQIDAPTALLNNFFYPDADVVVSWDAVRGIEISVGYAPQGFTPAPADIINVATNDSHVNISSLTNVSVGGVKAGWWMRSRNDQLSAGISQAETNLLSSLTDSQVRATYPILPYQTTTLTDFESHFSATVVKPTHNLHLGLGTSVDRPNGIFILPASNPYEQGTGTPLVFRKYFDNYSGVNGYNWIETQWRTGGAISTRYLLSRVGDPDVIDYYVADTPPVAPSGNYTIIMDAGELDLGAILVDNPAVGLATQFTPAQLIQRQSENAYDLVLAPNGAVEVQYNGTVLNQATPLQIADGDELRWVIHALDDHQTSDIKHPVPQHKVLGTNVYNDIPIDAGLNIPDVRQQDQLIPTLHCDGLCDAGAIGSGTNGQIETAQSFLAGNMTITNKVGLFKAGEILYQVGASTPVGGTGLRLMALVGASEVGGQGTITDVRVLGNGYEGNNLANGMAINMKGLYSGSTCTVTQNAVAGNNFTISGGGNTYQVGETYFLIPAGGSTSPPTPFIQTAVRNITNEFLVKRATISVTTIGAGGALTGFRVLDTGNGYQIGDGCTLLSTDGAGTGSLATIAINQVAEGGYQVVANEWDTKIVNFPPMTPQSTIDLNMNGLGDLINATPDPFRGNVDHNQAQPIITSASLPLPNNPANENILIDIVEFPIGSRNSGSEALGQGGRTDNHIATIPYQTDLNLLDENHKQHYEPYNITYHDLKNEHDLNLNELHVNLTNYDGTLRTDLAHPTQLTLHVQPEYR